VTVVEFSDFQCPFCARVLPALGQVRATYGPDKVRIVWKNHPLAFHGHARSAAEIAMGVFAVAGSDGFWKFHDLVFANQGALDDDHGLQWAQQAGIRDRPAFEAGLRAHRWAEAVDRDENEAETLGVPGTPTFLINGTLLEGAQPFESFRAVIDREMAASYAKMARGTPPARVYVEATGENRAAMANETDKRLDEERRGGAVVYRVPIGTSPARGSKDALVTIVEFGDLVCPYCVLAEETLAALQSKYGERLRVVWKNLPLAFHAAAEPAAEAALEVRAEKGDAAFWAVHDGILALPKGALTTNDASSIDAIVDVAGRAGADPNRVRQAVRGRTHAREIGADEDLAEGIDADGTPHFFINGRRLIGAQPLSKFESVIDEEIARASEIVARGQRPADVYVALTKDGKPPREPEKRELPASIPSGDPVRGAPTAKVAIHEWADFECPFCGRVEPTLEQLLKDYGGRVKLVWHDLPLPMHPRAGLAAEAARSAYAQSGTLAFWAIHDEMLASQEKLQRGDLDAYASRLKLDASRWSASLDHAEHAADIDRDRLAAGEAGIDGTPSFLIVPQGAKAGYFVSGAQSDHTFRRLVEIALTESR
jgi:protein-disulfide isomerase